MNFLSISDAIFKLLLSSVPEKKSPLLCLAQTDRQKQKRLENEDYELAESKKESTVNAALRRLCMRKGYKRPKAAAGLKTKVDDCSLNKGDYSINLKDPLTIAELEQEKRLRSQGTRAVVSLFNAVRQHQSSLKKKQETSGPLITHKEKALTSISKSDFLDRIASAVPGATSNKKRKGTADVSEESEEEAHAKPVQKKKRAFGGPLTTYSVRVKR